MKGFAFGAAYAILGLVAAATFYPRAESKAPAPPVVPYPWSVPEAGKASLYVTRVIDGDTFEAAFLVPVTCRVRGVNAPEHNDPGGKEAAEGLRGLIEGKMITADLYGREKYGRTLADPLMPDGSRLSDALIKAGWAKPYDGHGPRPK